MNKYTARRHRRRVKQQLSHGAESVRTHAKKTGRTGNIHAKKTPGKPQHYVRCYANPPVVIPSLGAGP